MSDDRVERLLSRLPVSQESLLAFGLKRFIELQEPEGVNFTVHNNGWSLDVKTSDEKTKEALEFWEEKIQPRL